MFSGDYFYFLVTTILLYNFKLSFAFNETCVIRNIDNVSRVIDECQDILVDNLIVPGGKQLTLELNNGTNLTFNGTTLFEFAEWAGPMVLIRGNNLNIKGAEGSLFDGQGELYWDGQGGWGNTTKPKVLWIARTTNTRIENINIRNCPKQCVFLRNSSDITLNRFHINNKAGDEGVAPDGKFAHNTDGFDIGACNNTVIENSIIYNQDDCIALSSGINVTIRNLYCHGSHGLSISGKAALLENVLFENCEIKNSENGIRVKTHVDTGAGLIKNATYNNIRIIDAKFFGIDIQQNYKNQPADIPIDGPPSNNIPIHDLHITNVHGNVRDDAVPIFILCADEGCFDWIWSNISLTGILPNNCTGFTPDGFTC